MVRRTESRKEPHLHECVRCGRSHMGAILAPGWRDRIGFGLVCDDCEETLHLAALTGRELVAA